jgi:hypothetical protein
MFRRNAIASLLGGLLIVGATNLGVAPRTEDASYRLPSYLGVLRMSLDSFAGLRQGPASPKPHAHRMPTKCGNTSDPNGTPCPPGP